MYRPAQAFKMAVPGALLFFLYPAFSLAVDIKVEGRVFTEFGPLKNAKVYVYKNYEDIRAGAAFLTSEATDDQGMYKFQLPEGEYYFTAKGINRGREFFSYHGGNPIRTGEENIWLTLMANQTKPPVYTEGTTSLKGAVTYKGKPAAGAYVSIYKPGNRRFKGMGVTLMQPVKDDGTFTFLLPPDNYVVIARKMAGDAKVRPVESGDLYCYYPQNPLEIKAGKTARIEVPCYPKGNRSAFAAAPPIKANDYLTVDKLSGAGKFGIKGKIMDAEHNPVKGIYVLAYKGDSSSTFITYHEIHDTEYIGKTDAAGGYFIPLDSDGSYRLIARSALGGSPQSNELYGVYSGTPWHGVSFKRGRVLDNTDIVVGEAVQERNNNKYTDKDNAARRVGNAVFHTDHVVEENTVWHGNILINGSVWVKKGVTLTIEPGTVMKFKRTDRDNNGIGDGEIIVEGRVVARGTKGNKILFTSLEEKPAPNDWSYVLLLSAGADNVFEYCEFRYAFTGFQAHYSTARIADCVFQDNQEAILYDRSHVVIEHNTLAHNDIGIRFMRLEGRVTIRENLITGNNIGILFMKPSRKTFNINAETPPHGLEPPLITNNNIYDNRAYNYKIGARKPVDLDAANNWWGSPMKKDIEKFIFDRKDDAALGRVLYFPSLRAPVENAGSRDGKS